MLVTPQEWIALRFGDAKKKPHPTSVRRWIGRGDIPGKQIGGRYYVEIDEERRITGNELVDKVMNG
jgi:hypothetical protein